jgi:aryl-alcohol dehydrogenase-like predicted oxidoreductase
MSAREELAGVLDKWLRLTRKEGAAIDSASWHDLRQIQAQKSLLKNSFAAAAQRCAAEGVALDPFRPAAARVLSLLTRNGEVLAAQMRQARLQEAALDENRRNLFRVQRSYVGRRSRAAWHCYS